MNLIVCVKNRPGHPIRHGGDFTDGDLGLCTQVEKAENLGDWRHLYSRHPGRNAADDKGTNYLSGFLGRK